MKGDPQGEFLVWDADDYSEEGDCLESVWRIDCHEPDAAAVLCAERRHDTEGWEQHYPRTFVVIHEPSGQKHHVRVDRETLVRFDYEATECEEVTR